MSVDYPSHHNNCGCSGCYHSNVTSGPKAEIAQLRASLAAVTAELNELNCYADSRVGELYVEVSGWKQRAEEAEAERAALAKQVEIAVKALEGVNRVVSIQSAWTVAQSALAAVKPK